MSSQTNLLDKVSDTGKAALAPVIEFSNVTIRVADRSIREQFQNFKQFARTGYQHAKAIPTVRSMKDVKAIAKGGKENTITYAKNSAEVVKEGLEDYKKWFKHSAKTLKSAFKSETKSKPKTSKAKKTTTQARKKSTAKATQSRSQAS